MAWCFSTRASVATALTTHPCVSRCLRVKQCDYISVLILTWAKTNSEEILLLGTPAEGSDCQLLGFLVWKLPQCQQGAFQVMVLVKNRCITWSFKSAYKEYKYNNETVLLHDMVHQPIQGESAPAKVSQADDRSAPTTDSLSDLLRTVLAKTVSKHF